MKNQELLTLRRRRRRMTWASQMHNPSMILDEQAGHLLSITYTRRRSLVSFSDEASFRCPCPTSFVQSRPFLQPFSQFFFILAEMEMLLHMCRWGVIILADMGKCFNGVTKWLTVLARMTHVYCSLANLSLLIVLWPIWTFRNCLLANLIFNPSN